MNKVGVAPDDIRVFDMVMLLYPVVLFSPVTVKDTVVAEDWFVAMVTLDICELVMFPVIVRSIVVPLSVIAFTVASYGVGEGVGVGVGVWFGVLVGFGVDIGFGVGVGGGVISGVGGGEFVTANKLLTPVQFS